VRYGATDVQLVVVSDFQRFKPYGRGDLWLKRDFLRCSRDFATEMVRVDVGYRVCIVVSERMMRSRLVCVRGYTFGQLKELL
jgi:hypothetical protein